MAKKHVVVDGANCKCKNSETPVTDILKVKSQNIHFANDKAAEKQLIATTKEIGQTLEKNTFGNCKLQPMGSSFKPCQVVIKEWSGSYEKVTLSNEGKILLLESSKATCATMGVPDCIEISNHGQKPEISKQQMQAADREVLMQINPLLNLDELENDDCIYS